MTAFLNGKTAYKVKDTDDYKGYEVVVINSETLGYSKDDRFIKVYEEKERAQGVVDKLNDQLGVTALEADAVFICSSRLSSGVPVLMTSCSSAKKRSAISRG